MISYSPFVLTRMIRAISHEITHKHSRCPRKRSDPSRIPTPFQCAISLPPRCKNKCTRKDADGRTRERKASSEGEEGRGRGLSCQGARGIFCQSHERARQRSSVPRKADGKLGLRLRAYSRVHVCVLYTRAVCPALEGNGRGGLVP